MVLDYIGRNLSGGSKTFLAVLVTRMHLKAKRLSLVHFKNVKWAAFPILCDS